jgi:hypothetical protein
LQAELNTSKTNSVNKKIKIKKQDWTTGKKNRAFLQAEIEGMTVDAERKVLHFFFMLYLS